MSEDPEGLWIQTRRRTLSSGVAHLSKAISAVWEWVIGGLILDSGFQGPTSLFAFPRDTLVKLKPVFVYPGLRNLGHIFGEAVALW